MNLFFWNGITVDEFVECVELFVLIEFELASFNLALDFRGIVFRLFFAISMDADSGVTFDTDDRTPAFAVFTFIDRCHSPTLCV